VTIERWLSDFQLCGAQNENCNETIVAMGITNIEQQNIEYPTEGIYDYGLWIVALKKNHETGTPRCTNDHSKHST
jgi:hypothetical protein